MIGFKIGKKLKIGDILGEMVDPQVLFPSMNRMLVFGLMVDATPLLGYHGVTIDPIELPISLLYSIELILMRICSEN